MPPLLAPVKAIVDGCVTTGGAVGMAVGMAVGGADPLLRRADLMGWVQKRTD